MYLTEPAKSKFGPEESVTTDVVVIDDEPSMCEGCRQTLEAEGYRAAVAPDGPRGLALVEQDRPSVVIVDLKIPHMSGVEVLAKLSEIDPTIVSIVITGYPSIDSAVESMRTGAFDFLTKPFEPDQLLDSVRRGIELSQARKRVQPRPAGLAPAEVSETAALDKPDVLLRGLEALGQYYSLGLGKRDFLEELSHLEVEAKYHAETLGQIRKKEKAIRDIVQDLRVVDEVVAKHEYKKTALLQILLDVQTRLNWVPRHALKWISRRLKVALGSLYSIATFYEALSLEPRGAHLVEICTGTACHVRGAPRLNTTVSALLGIQPGETDPEQVFTLRTVHCMGCCALAPVIKIDDQYYSNPSMQKLERILSSYRDKREQTCQN